MKDDRIRILKCLANETRFNIIGTLLEKEKNVSEIVKKVKKSQPTVSIHLKLLELNGMITSKRQGKFVIYQIENKILSKIVNHLR